MREHKVDVMIGCASFEGTDPRRTRWRCASCTTTHWRPPSGAAARTTSSTCRWICIAKDKVDAKAALKALPPLIKGYLRLGAFVGDGAVIDRQFGTTDVLIILPVEKIDPRYFGHFGAPEETRSRVAVDG